MPADTDDHIPPRALFAKRTGSRLVTVKSCRRCNEGVSDDDEYFRDTVLKYHRVSELPRAESQVAAMLRAAANPRKARYTAATLRGFTEVSVITPAGIDLGVQPAYRVNGDRIERAARRYVRGLHRHELGRRVPDSAEVMVAVNPEAVFDEQPQIVSIFRGGAPRVVEEGVFWYTSVRAIDNPEASGWLLVFFDEFAIIGSVRSPTPRIISPAA
jgi:hypothetical protein